jgi:peroxisomal trans-2-enoyl-CoA reductase
MSGIFRPNLLRNKTALVTGGATGIGHAIAKDLLQLGCHVLIASRNESNLLAAVTDLKQTTESNKISHFRCDIRQPDDVEALFTHAVQTMGGPLDLLVNNGGGQFPAAAETITDNGWDAVINTNLNGTFRMCREAFTTGQMKDHGGSIVNIICTYFQGFPGMAHTGAARAGVDNLTKTLAMEWQRYGIRVNSCAPGVIYSSSAESNYSNQEKHANNQFDQYLSTQAPRIPMRRLGTTQEVSNMVR